MERTGKYGPPFTTTLGNYERLTKMRNILLVVGPALILVCQSTPVSADSSPCIASIPPPVVQISPNVVVINSTTVTPTLSKDLFFKELKEPCREVRGKPGTPERDGYLYDKSLGLRFHTVTGKQTVTTIHFCLEDTSWCSRFNGKIVVTDKELPLDNVDSIQRVRPDLGLDYDRDVDPHQAKAFGLYAASIGKWKLSVKADGGTGVIKGISVAFKSVVCVDEQDRECFERVSGKWRAQ